MKPTDDNDECMFIDKAEYIRAEDHKIVLDKLKKVEQSNKYMTNDLNEMMKYIKYLENHVYKLVDKLESIEIDVDEDVDEPSNETEIQFNENMVRKDELRFVKWFDNNKDYSSDWEKNLKIVKDIKSRIFKQQNNINDCMFSNHKKKANQLNQTEVQSNEKDIDFVEIGNDVFLNKKTNQTYEIADDNDLNEDLF